MTLAHLQALPPAERFIAAVALIEQMIDDEEEDFNDLIIFGAGTDEDILIFFTAGLIGRTTGPIAVFGRLPVELLRNYMPQLAAHTEIIDRDEADEFAEEYPDHFDEVLRLFPDSYMADYYNDE